MIDLSQFKIWSVEEFERAFPPPPDSSRPNGSGVGAQGATGGAGSANEIDEADLTNDLLEWIHDGVPKSEDRSVVFFRVVKALKKLGYGVEGIFNLLDRYPSGIAQKYRDRKYSGSRARLQKEVGRAYDRKLGIEANPAASSSSVVNLSAPSCAAPNPPVPNLVAPNPAPAPPATLSFPLPQPLIDAHATFRKWLGEKCDTEALDIVLATAAADKLGGDPLWLMVISGSGNAKTETVRSLAGAGALVTSVISSEGALLSATARSRGATGGLLYKIGPRGILVIKDFTSTLESNSNVRNPVLAAFREIHDGRWERNVGFAGGRTLTWTGRITVVAACTTAWDEARKVVATMGDRFVVVRADSTTGREEAALKAIENTGQEDKMRTELAAVVGKLIVSINMNAYQLSEAERERLIKLANLVTWARTGVERDYKGAVVEAHALEMPTRFAKQLGQVVRGAVSCGMPTQTAMQLATRCARDSLEPRRRDILLYLVAHPSSAPDAVHARLICPLTTVTNHLTALHTLRLLQCEEREEWRGRRTFLVPYYTLAPELDQATLLSI
jgi:hypothetical protein